MHVRRQGLHQIVQDIARHDGRFEVLAAVCHVYGDAGTLFGCLAFARLAFFTWFDCNAQALGIFLSVLVTHIVGIHKHAADYSFHVAVGLFFDGAGQCRFLGVRDVICESGDGGRVCQVERSEVLLDAHIHARYRVRGTRKYFRKEFRCSRCSPHQKCSGVFRGDYGNENEIATARGKQCRAVQHVKCGCYVHILSRNCSKILHTSLFFFDNRLWRRRCWRLGRSARRRHLVATKSEMQLQVLVKLLCVWGDAIENKEKKIKKIK